MGVATVVERKVSLEAGHLEDVRLAASKMTGARRRAYLAERAWKYCRGSTRRAEDVFGWSRQAVQLGLHEKRTGIVCLGLHTFCCGAKLWRRNPRRWRRPRGKPVAFAHPQLVLVDVVVLYANAPPRLCRIASDGIRRKGTATHRAGKYLVRADRKQSRENCETNSEHDTP